MKILQSESINAFGGINFVLNEFDTLDIADTLDSNLPELSNNSLYSWKDIFYSFSSIYYCGGDCIEDINTVLSNQFKVTPLFKLCSPDTVLRRFKSLATKDEYCTTPRGTVTHQYNTNELLTRLNINLLKSLGSFKETITLDYDNTIVFNEKNDSKMTYKKQYGYQPGVCLLNNTSVVYIENRNGNSDAKSFQSDTLCRIFEHLHNANIKNINFFRADAASYQYEVIKTLENHVDSFYIGTKNAYVEKYYTQIDNWKQTKDQIGDDIWIGSINYTPFSNRYPKGVAPKTYRLLVKKKCKPTTQLDIFTQDNYQYHSIITNDCNTEMEKAISFYYQRGAAEKQFDILKNDFGWNHMPFSNLSQNNVFLYFAAICSNLYKVILQRISSKCEKIKPTYRIKKFIFYFIAIPTKWVQKARQWHLRIYGNLTFKT